MLIGDMGITRLIIHVEQVEEGKMKDKEESNNKKSKTLGNEFEQQKSNANRCFFQHKKKGTAPSFTNAPTKKQM